MQSSLFLISGLILLGYGFAHPQFTPSSAQEDTVGNFKLNLPHSCEIVKDGKKGYSPTVRVEILFPQELAKNSIVVEAKNFKDARPESLLSGEDPESKGNPSSIGADLNEQPSQREDQDDSTGTANQQSSEVGESSRGNYTLLGDHDVNKKEQPVRPGEVVDEGRQRGQLHPSVLTPQLVETLRQNGVFLIKVHGGGVNVNETHRSDGTSTQEDVDARQVSDIRQGSNAQSDQKAWQFSSLAYSFSGRGKDQRNIMRRDGAPQEPPQGVVYAQLEELSLDFELSFKTPKLDQVDDPQKTLYFTVTQYCKEGEPLKWTGKQSTTPSIKIIKAGPGTGSTNPPVAGTGDGYFNSPSMMAILFSFVALFN